MRLGLAGPAEKKAAEGYTDSGSGVPEVERPWCLQPVYQPDPRAVFRQPLPGEDALHGDDQVCPVGGHEAQKCYRGGRQILMDQNRSTLLQDTDVHGLRR